jgi:hypothetical protein
VLSGTGTEGAIGAREVRAAGGLVIAQTPESAADPDMPNSAIAIGGVDLILRPERMPAALLAFAAPPSRPGAAPDRAASRHRRSAIDSVDRSRAYRARFPGIPAGIVVAAHRAPDAASRIQRRRRLCGPRSTQIRTTSIGSPTIC